MPAPRFANVYISTPSSQDPQLWVQHFRTIQAPPGVQYRFCFRHSLQGDWPRIQSMILAADVVVADFSPTAESGTQPDPGVLTETALARLGPKTKPIILLHRQSNLALPFDWRQLMKLGGVNSVNTQRGMEAAMREVSGWLGQIISQPVPPPPQTRAYNGQSWDVYIAQSLQRGDGSPGFAGFDFASFYGSIRQAADRIKSGPKVRLALVTKDRDSADVWQRIVAGMAHCAMVVVELTPDARSGAFVDADVLTELCLATFYYHLPVLPVMQTGTKLPEYWTHLQPLYYDRYRQDVLVDEFAPRLEKMLKEITGSGKFETASPSKRIVPSEATRFFGLGGNAGPTPPSAPPPAIQAEQLLPPPTAKRWTPSKPVPVSKKITEAAEVVAKQSHSQSTVQKAPRLSAPSPAPGKDSTTTPPSVKGQQMGLTADAAAGPFQKFLDALNQQQWADALKSYNEAIQLDPWQHALFNPERFRADEVLGAGPFGVVFKATILPTPEEPEETPVVIKALLKTERLGQDADQLFSNIDLLRQAPRQGVLMVLDWDRYPRGEANAYWHLWSPYYPNTQSLDRLLAQRGTLPEPATREIAAGIVRGLMSAAVFHVPHLALRPQNVLVRQTGNAKWEVWLRDFGFYPDFTQSMNEQEWWFANVRDYAAPEQRHEIPVTPGTISDIYTLGLIMLTALYGAPTIDADTLEKIGLIKDANLRSAIEGCLRYDTRSRWQQLEPILELLQPGATPISIHDSSMMPAAALGLGATAQAVDVFSGVEVTPGATLDSAFAEEAIDATPVEEHVEVAPTRTLLRGATREEGPLRPKAKMLSVDKAPARLFEQDPLPPRERPVPKYTKGGRRPLIVGIDLGTCKSVLAYVDRYGDIKVVHHTTNSIITPSAVYFPEPFVAEVGLDAKRMAVFEPLSCAQFFKLNMGDPRRARTFHGSKFTPEMLSALVLRRLVDQAVEKLGGAEEVEIHDVVITVPSSWDDVRRDATRLAARLANLNPIGIISEPVAVALEVSLKELRAGKTVLVYDFGGGTFDVTIFRLEGKTVRLLANVGLPTLGGKDLDQKLYDHVRLLFRDEFAEQNPPDPDDRPQSRWELLSRCEDVKIALCRNSPPKPITVTSGGCTGKYTVSLEDFERLIAPEIETTKNFVQGAMLDAGLKPKDIDFVLPVGGSSQIPAALRLLAEMFGAEKVHNRHVNPQETVARGACRNAADLWCEAVRRRDIPAEAIPPHLMEKLGDAAVLREETPQALSMITVDEDGQSEMTEVVVPQGTPWPARGSIVAETAEDHQMNVICRLRSGSNPEPDATERLGTVSFPLVPGVPKGCPLKIEFWYDGPDRLYLAMWDGASGQTQQLKVPWPGPTHKQVTQWHEVVNEVKVVID